MALHDPTTLSLERRDMLRAKALLPHMRRENPGPTWSDAAVARRALHIGLKELERAAHAPKVKPSTSNPPCPQCHTAQRPQLKEVLYTAFTCRSCGHVWDNLVGKMLWSPGLATHGAWVTNHLWQSGNLEISADNGYTANVFENGAWELIDEAEWARRNAV